MGLFHVHVVVRPPRCVIDRGEGRPRVGDVACSWGSGDDCRSHSVPLVGGVDARAAAEKAEDSPVASRTHANVAKESCHRGLRKGPIDRLPKTVTGASASRARRRLTYEKLTPVGARMEGPERASARRSAAAFVSPQLPVPQVSSRPAMLRYVVPREQAFR
jgi:hypothetical protein